MRNPLHWLVDKFTPPIELEFRTLKRRDHWWETHNGWYCKIQVRKPYGWVSITRWLCSDYESELTLLIRMENYASGYKKHRYEIDKRVRLPNPYWNGKEKLIEYKPD